MYKVNSVDYLDQTTNLTEELRKVGTQKLDFEFEVQWELACVQYHRFSSMNRPNGRSERSSDHGDIPSFSGLDKLSPKLRSAECRSAGENCRN